LKCITIAATTTTDTAATTTTTTTTIADTASATASAIVELLMFSVIRDEFREHPPHTLDVPLGGESLIPCRPPRGKPDARVRWMKDGAVVETSNRISVEDSGTLRIQDTTREDTGVYVCVAYNIAGEKESIPCQLTVKGNWALVLSFSS